MKKPLWTQEQLAEISRIQEQRNLTRKGALQFYRRQQKNAPVDKPETLHSDTLGAVTIPANETHAPVVERPAPTAKEKLSALLATSHQAVRVPGARAMRAVAKAAKPTKKAQLSRREEKMASAAFKKAFAADLKARPDYRKCKHGHDTTRPENVHVGDLLRTGKRTCNVCWQKSQAAWLKKAAK